MSSESPKFMMPTMSVELSERGLTEFCENLAKLGVMSGPAFRDWSQRMNPVMNRLSREGRSQSGSASSKKRRPGSKKKGAGKAGKGSGNATTPSLNQERKTKAVVNDDLTLSGLQKIIKKEFPSEESKVAGNLDLTAWSRVKDDKAQCALLDREFEALLQARLGDRSSLTGKELALARKEVINLILAEAGLNAEEIRTSRRYFPRMAHLKPKRPKGVEASDSEAEGPESPVRPPDVRGNALNAGVLPSRA